MRARRVNIPLAQLQEAYSIATGGQQLAPGTLEALVSQLDTDGDGRVSMAEFRRCRDSQSSELVSQNGGLLSRRGCSLPASVSGSDTHRAAITSRFVNAAARAE
jgi:hypothetical protein